MTDWIYRATPAKASCSATVELLESGFICRTAHSVTGARIPNAEKVKVGDVIHLAYRDHDAYAPLGAFIVTTGAMDAAEPAAPGSDAGLRRVSKGSVLEASLLAAGYAADPKLDCHVGWCVEEVLGVDPPDFDAALNSSGQNALHQLAVDAAPHHVKPQAPLHAAVAPRPQRSVGGGAAAPSGSGRTEIARAGGIRVVGVDWSGAATAGKKIWQAHLVVDETIVLAHLDRPFRASPARKDVLAAFPRWFASTEADVVGFDFCFGVARSQLPSLLHAAGQQHQPPSSAMELGALVLRAFDDPDSFREACGREARRDTDRLQGAPFAPTNLRMYRQTWFGLACLGSLSSVSVLPWDDGPSPVAIEVLPAKGARARGHGRYKGRSATALAAREALVAEIEETVQISDEHRAALVGDAEGDAVDAVLAALEALSARDRGFSGVPRSAVDEGWIY